MAKQKSRSKHTPRIERNVLFNHQPNTEQAEQILSGASHLLKLKQTEAASKLLSTLLKVDPANPEALYLQGKLQMEVGGLQQALEYFRIAAYQMPNNAKLYGYLAQIHWQLNEPRAALSSLIRAVELDSSSSRSIFILGALYYSLGQKERGRYWIHQGVRQEPISLSKGNVSKDKAFTLLVLKSAESTEWSLRREPFEAAMREGHNNLPNLLDGDNIDIVHLFVDHIDKTPEVARKLPKVDLVYNGITDADRCVDALQNADKLCIKLGVPVINSPPKVLRTTREDNYHIFKNSNNVVLPRSVKYECTQSCVKSIAEKATREHGFQLPIIVRLGGYQTGKYMHKVDDLVTHDFSELDAEIAQQSQTVYVVQYHEFGYHDEHMKNDMLYLKYRAFLIGGKLYPAHLRGDINQYKVHINNEIFNLCPWLENYEDHFLRDPVDYFGNDHWQNLENSLKELKVDYLGVDFAVEKSSEHQGKILIFEANASMRNWPTLRNDTPHVYGAWQKNMKAIHSLFCERAGVAPWEFELPQIVQAEKKPENPISLRLQISGSVQNVGYRSWFTEQLEERNIPGWVRNLSDGSVEAVIHGPQPELQLLLDEVPKGPDGADVTDLNADIWEGEVPVGVQILESAT